MVRSAPIILFEETPYGIVKRIEVIGQWIRQVRQRTGNSRLTILDYGCGTGSHITFPLASMGHKVLGIDSHEPSILEARRNYTLPNLSFRTGVLEDLVKENQTFDLIVCSEVLEHHSEPFDFLLGLRRLIGPAGALIMTTPNGYGSYEMLCRLEPGLRRIGVHQLLRWIFRGGRQLARQLSGHTASVRPIDKLPEDQNPGFLNRESGHVQFFRLRTLEALFRDSGFHVASRRARTFLCGPYVDVLFGVCPFRQALYRMNNRLADLLPFAWAADWMFLLERREGSHS